MLNYFLFCLALTLAIELLLALLWGLRGQDLILCALANLLTNPAVVLLNLIFPVPWFLLLPSCRGQAQPLELDMWDRHFGKRKKLFSFHCKTKNSVSAVCSSSQH